MLYANDLMLFTNASVQVAGNIKQFLHHFWLFTGLQVNNEKSSIFVATYDNDTASGIVTVLGFTLRDLPLKYLGIPLSARKINLADCQPLLDKVRQKLVGWKGYVGRLEQIKSTLSSLHILWSSCFLLPRSCLDQLDQIARNFFWGYF